jgi:hypothetical protein
MFGVCMFLPCSQTERRTDIQTDGQTDGRTDGQTDRQTDRQTCDVDNRVLEVTTLAPLNLPVDLPPCHKEPVSTDTVPP